MAYAALQSFPQHISLEEATYIYICYEHRVSHEPHPSCDHSENVSSQKIMTYPGIATNTLVLYRPVPGGFANSIVFLDDTELAKFSGQQYKGGFEI